MIVLYRMIVQKFNQWLEQYSHQVTHLRMLKSSLALHPPQNISSYLFSLDAEGRGFFTKDDIYRIWLQSLQTSKQQCNAFINNYFDYQKVSYTVIESFLLQQNQQGSEAKQYGQPEDIVNQIFSLSLSAYLLQQQILQKMDRFIPMKYSRPTEQELTNYVVCQHITVDIKQVSNALNLLPNNPHSKQKELMVYDKSLCNPSVSKLQDIMKRLQNRVNTFGKEWLTK